MSARRILVVEDNPMNLKLVRDVLSYAGYEVIEATTGEDGVRLAARGAPDLILMDLQLPGHRRRRGAAPDPRGEPTRARPGRRGHRVRDGRGPRAARFDAGFDGYVEKPISVRALPQQVRDFLDRGGAP